MKLPISFGSRLFYRVVIPGFIVSSTLFAHFFPISLDSGFSASIAALFLASVLGLGWLFLLLDKLIYILLEGRRYWPAFLRNHLLKSERRRLLRIHQYMRKYDTHRPSNNIEKPSYRDCDRLYLENAVTLAQFPLDLRSVMPTPMWPTRMGNLIAAYEQYPFLKYGMDSVFYWPRIWLSMDSSAREEIDSSQAQADGAVYSSVAFLISSVLFLFFVVLDFFWGFKFSIGIGLFERMIFSLSLLALMYGSYRASLAPLQQFGDLFMSAFDKYRDSVSMKGVDELLKEMSNSSYNENAGFPERNMAIWRFLKWHRLRVAEGRNVRARVTWL